MKTTTTLVLRRLASTTALAGLMTAAGISHAVEIERSLRVKLGAIAESARDLGQSDADDTAEGYAEIDPAVRLKFSEDLSVYGRAQAFAPTDTVVFDENEQATRSKEYVALRELWLEYGGLTSYPGEVVRLGLQRIRQPDGQWIDRDIESVRWLFDTTLIQAELGVAQQFATYRTDDVELSRSQKDRGYVFGDMSSQWRPGHFVGLRGVYADDQKAVPAVGSATDEDTKLADRRLGWMGVRAENGYFDISRSSPFSYWTEVSLLAGRQQQANTAPVPDPADPTAPAAGTVTDVRSNGFSAVAMDFGLRARLEGAVPVVVGAAYAIGQGQGSDASYQQTGLQSNRSRFTGTRALLHRYNEAYRAELSNLQVLTGFVSLPGERYDASLVFSQFRRDDPEAPVIVRGLDVQPVAGDADLGRGVDLVISRYFGGLGKVTSFDDDLRSNVRLRAALFSPGSAYGDDADEQYRVLLETTLWF